MLPQIQTDRHGLQTFILLPYSLRLTCQYIRIQGKPLFRYLDFPRERPLPKTQPEKEKILMSGIAAPELRKRRCLGTKHSRRRIPPAQHSSCMLTVSFYLRFLIDKIFLIASAALQLLRPLPSFLISDSRHPPRCADQCRSKCSHQPRMQKCPGLLISCSSQQTSAHHRQGHCKRWAKRQIPWPICPWLQLWRSLNFKCLIIQRSQASGHPMHHTHGLLTYIRYRRPLPECFFLKKYRLSAPYFQSRYAGIHCQNIS